MKRIRPSVVVRLFSAVAFCCVFASAAPLQAAKRPSVLLIMADDQNYTDVGCYGNDEVKTPNIDRLASQGMRLTRCFTATAMCSPTRQQLYTGLFPVRNGAYPNHSRVKPGTRSMVHYFKELGYRVGLSGKFHIGPAESFDFERMGGSPDFRLIKRFVSRDPSQPFLLVVTSHSPHTPWSQGDASAYPPETLTVPAWMVDTPETREALGKYYAEITDFDREVGLCMEILAKSGRQDDTIFVYTSEQGSAFPYCKWTCYDLGLRTALVIRWPGHVEPASVSDAMVQYVDVIPTLLDAAAGKTIDGLDGRSFLPVLLGEQETFRDVVYGVHTTRGIIGATPSGYPVRSIRSDRYKYIANLNDRAAFSNWVTVTGFSTWQSWVRKAKTDPFAARRVAAYQHRPAEEFYDVVSDPLELNNLAGDPEYRQEMDRMRERLRAWMKQQGDEGLATELARPERKKAGQKKP